MSSTGATGSASPAIDIRLVDCRYRGSGVSGHGITLLRSRSEYVGRYRQICVGYSQEAPRSKIRPWYQSPDQSTLERLQ